jgi:type IV fimbrial biogenesis protein FimT
MSPASAARPRGLTLVEILIGIALMAIVLALVAPSMRELIAAQRVRSINAELVTDLQYARSEAVRRQVPVSVDFLQNTTYTCYAVRTGLITCNCLRGPGAACGTREIKTVRLPRNLDVAFDAAGGFPATLSFDPVTGNAVPAAFGIDVESASRGSLRVQTNALGRASICSPGGKFNEVPTCVE